MARLIRHTATGPVEIKPQEKSAWVCACGLSQNLPLCDGSHCAARAEAPGTLCVYDNDRKTVLETRTETK